MTDTQTPPSEPGAALLRAGRFFRPCTPASEDRCVIPTAAVGDARRPEESAFPDDRGLAYDGGPGMGGDGPFGQDSGRRLLPVVPVENFHGPRGRQTSDDPADAEEV
ncbi:hypothetical protein ACFWWC_09555 [Streptomyces sp. NPDC058642]|uniref:hypothetical protein n=1 Tax=Streptomyces sp. NPDC058642 TaxID=3346572 RepID=UPI00364E4B2A